MQKLILIGAGGQAKSVADSIDESQMTLVGFIDGVKTGEHIGRPILGRDVTDIPDYKSYVYHIAIGDVNHRALCYDRLTELGVKLVNIIDKTAIIAKSAKIGNGNFIGKLAIINSDAKIGDNCIINTRALVEHESVVGNHSHISTNSTINGNVEVGERVFFGSTSVCNGQLTIGKGAVVGAGSVIIADVEEETTVVGVPARAIKHH